MPNSHPFKGVMIQFGEFIFDSSNARVVTIADGQELPIEPKLVTLLSLFLEQPNTIITRDAFHERLWPGSLVTDNAINKLVGNLRKALGDEAKNPRYIQTIPKRGYRLVCEVRQIHTNPTAKADDNPVMITTTGNGSGNNKKGAPFFKSGFVIAILAVIGFLMWHLVPVERDSANWYSKPLTRAKGIEFSPRVHPDNEHVYYLNQIGNRDPELWLLNQTTGSSRRIHNSAHITRLVAVVKDKRSEGETNTQLIYLSKSQQKCSVEIASLPNPLATEQIMASPTILFDCTDKRIKDVDYHKQQRAIYYTAQPESFWPNQIFAFDMVTGKTITPTQPEPKGWGHHSIDISPDGEKLLIMSTDNDHNTHLYSLNLSTHEITEGRQFNRFVGEAIWHHDSRHVYYHSPPPAYQIMASDLRGNNEKAMISVSEEQSSEMVRVGDEKHLLFSTDHSNFNNRWLLGGNNLADISNSTVSDTSPILFHHSDQYLFASKRSGETQLYLGSYHSEEPVTLTKFNIPYSLGYLALSADDQHLLISMNDKVYHLPIAELIEASPFTSFSDKHLLYTSEKPIISLDWFGTDKAAITVVDNGNPELIVVNLSGHEIESRDGNWAYGLTDSEVQNGVYVIEQQSNALYHVALPPQLENKRGVPARAQELLFNLPQYFYHVKIDQGMLYYMTTEDDVEYLHRVSLIGIDETTKYPLNPFSGYDVSQGKIMVSDMADREGDIYTTADR